MIDENQLNQISGPYFDGQWTAQNYTEFWGRKLADGLTLRTGTLQPRFFQSKIEHKPEHLPINFDATENWPGLVTGITDQGWCGASWAISTASVQSDRFAIQSNGVEQVTLAPQQFLDCIRKQRGCYGGHVDVAWNYFRKFG